MSICVGYCGTKPKGYLGCHPSRFASLITRAAVAADERLSALRITTTTSFAGLVVRIDMIISSLGRVSGKTETPDDEATVFG